MLNLLSGFIFPYFDMFGALSAMKIIPPPGLGPQNPHSRPVSEVISRFILLVVRASSCPGDYILTRVHHPIISRTSIDARMKLAHLYLNQFAAT
jgi:hypothetical protein